MSVIIRLQNLPWSATSVDIRHFFKGLGIPEGGVHIVGGDLGDTFIAFSTDEDARQAMQLTGKPLKGAAVTLLLSSRAEMQKVIETARNPSVAVAGVEPEKPATAIQKQIDLKDSDRRDRSRTHSRERDRGSRDRDRSSRDRDRNSRDRDRSSREKDRDRYGSRSRRDRSRSRSRSHRDRRDTDRRDRKPDRSRRDGDKRRSPEPQRDVRAPKSGKGELTNNIRDLSSTQDDWSNQLARSWPPRESENLMENKNMGESRNPMPQRNQFDSRNVIGSDDFNIAGANNNRMNINIRSNRWPDSQTKTYGDQQNSLGKSPGNASVPFGSNSLVSPNSNQMERISNPIRNSAQYFYIQLRGFPLNVTDVDVRDFLRGIYIQNDGIVLSSPHSLRGRSGTVHVKLTSPIDLAEALKRHRNPFAGSLIDVFTAKEDDYFGAGGIIKDTQEFHMSGDSAVVLMKSLPYQCQNMNVCNFFRDLQIANIVLVHDRNDCFIGEAFVEFNSPNDAKKALTYSGGKMGPCAVEIVMASKDQLMKAAPKPEATVISKPPQYPVLLQGLPFNASERDIIEFFSDGGPSPVAIHILLTGNGMATGEAFAEFSGQQNANQALRKNNSYIGLRAVSVKPLSANEMQDVLSTTRHISSNYPHSSSHNDRLESDNSVDNSYTPNQRSVMNDSLRSTAENNFGQSKITTVYSHLSRPGGIDSKQDLPNRINEHELSNSFNNRQEFPGRINQLENFGSPNQQLDSRNHQTFGNRPENYIPTNNKDVGDFSDNRSFPMSHWNMPPNPDDKSDRTESSSVHHSFNIWKNGPSRLDNQSMSENMTDPPSRSTRWGGESNRNFDSPDLNYSGKGGILPPPKQNDDRRDSNDRRELNGRRDFSSRHDFNDDRHGLNDRHDTNVRFGFNDRREQNDTRDLNNSRHFNDIRDSETTGGNWLPNQKRDQRADMMPNLGFNNLDTIQNKIPMDRQDSIAGNFSEQRNQFNMERQFEPRHNTRPEMRQDLQNVMSEPIQFTMQNKRPETRQDMMQNKSTEPRQDLMQNWGLEPRQDVGRNRSEPRQDVEQNRRPDSRQGMGLEPRQNFGQNRSEPRQDVEENRRPNLRQDMGQNRRSEPRKDMGQNRRAEPRQNIGHNRRLDHRQDVGQNKRPESRQDLGQKRRSENNQDVVGNRRTEKRQDVGQNRRSESRHDMKTPDRKQEVIESKRSESREETSHNKRSEPRQDTKQNNRVDPQGNKSEINKEVGQNKKSESKQETSKERKQDTRHNNKSSSTEDCKKADSKQEVNSKKSDSRSSQRQSSSQSKKTESRQDANQEKKAESDKNGQKKENTQKKKSETEKEVIVVEDKQSITKEKFSNRKPDLCDELSQNKSDSRQQEMGKNQPGLRQEIVQNKRTDQMPQNNPEMWLETNFNLGPFSNFSMDDKPKQAGLIPPSNENLNRSGPGRMGMMNDPTVNQNNFGARLNPNGGPVIRSGSPGMRMPMNYSMPMYPNPMQYNRMEDNRFLDQRMENSRFPRDNQQAIKRPLMQTPGDFSRPSRFMSGGEAPKIRIGETMQSDRFGDPGCVVGASNVPFHAGVEELLDFFRGFGIRKDNISRRFNENGRPTGDARVVFRTSQDAVRVVKELNNKVIYGRPISLFLL